MKDNANYILDKICEKMNNKDYFNNNESTCEGTAYSVKDIVDRIIKEKGDPYTGDGGVRCL